MAVKKTAEAKKHEPKSSVKPIKIKHPGALHRATHTPKGEKIPEAKIQKALHSKSKKIRKEAQFAENMDHSK